MVEDGDYTAVLDRFEEDEHGRELAVLLLEQDGSVVDEFIIERSELPPEVTQDAVLEVTFDSGEPTVLRFDRDQTEDRIDSAQRRFDELARRPPEGEEEGKN